MNPYFVWLGIVTFAFIAYCITVWYRSRKRSKFQARLSILFFFFVLVPTVTLVLVSSYLFTRSSDILTPPEVENALSRSLDILRNQFNKKGQTFIDLNPDFPALNKTIIENNGISYAGMLEMRQKQAFYTFFSSIEPDIDRPIFEFTGSNYHSIQSQKFLSLNVPYNNKNYFEYYCLFPDSTIKFVGFEIPGNQLNTQREISRILKNYTSLSLFLETIIEKKIIWAFAIGLLVLLGLISFQLTKIISKGLSEPIKQLTDGMKRVGSGDLSHRIDIKAKDEIGFLVDSFNQMAEELMTSRENLKRAERAAAWRDVARQISHEIKNPLTPIELSLYRLKTSLPQEIKTGTDFSESIKIIEEEIASMRKLASEFSEFARMPKLEKTDQDITEIINNSAKLYASHPIKLFFDHNIPPIPLDREQMRRVFNNLIKNAIEASQENEPIEIHVAKKERKLEIKIIDSGCGIDEKDMQKILDPYFTTKKEGTGLGLFIVHRIITEHGGELIIQSQKNKGTTIFIYL
ncbi:HAMP domain-containing protein [candidate division KSB1 bacterium]|nr:HAMP domain-containing protein [candidate division KSB1 bacterium]